MKPRIWLSLLPLTMFSADNYTAERVRLNGVEVVRLADTAHKTLVSIMPGAGNTAFEMSVNGKNVFWFPTTNLGEWQAKPVFSGNPFMAPWANRLDHHGFWANGKHYALDQELKNYRIDSFGQPIHGLLQYAKEWTVVDVKADAGSAMLRSRLEFWRYPDYMAQFPFAHSIEVVHRLADGTLEVRTSIENHSSVPMPVSVGYHPYFRVTDAPRDQWTVTLAAKELVKLSSRLLPTGERVPLPYSNPVKLAGIAFDDVMTDLVRGESGRAEFSVRGAREQVSVLFGPKYPVAVVYAPPGRDFICFEPMSGPTNAFNLHHSGKLDSLQKIAPGGSWTESYWIVPSGF
jgi:aldose 1-epimerase